MKIDWLVTGQKLQSENNLIYEYTVAGIAPIWLYHSLYWVIEKSKKKRRYYFFYFYNSNNNYIMHFSVWDYDDGEFDREK